VNDERWTGRGTPWEYDEGPPEALRWSTLFAATPNYRALGVARAGTELFRWHYGPMFYRGRLERNAVKVLVIGQEGAQDESLAHRSFVGGTGGRLQYFLAQMGITHGYLFLNTFVYPIFGQYDTRLTWLAQNAASPIVQHRQSIFDYAAEINDLRLVIAVGKAAQDSVKTWQRLRTTPIGPKTRVVGVMHPGAAAAGAAAEVIASFKAALKKIAGWVRDDASWLPADPGATRSLDVPFRYRSAPVPFADLPFGVAWRLGNGGTSSNRRDGQRGIQLFSDDGRYNNTGATLSYPGDAGDDEGYQQDGGDLAYEPPRAHPRDFDAGPGSTWAKLLMGGAPNLAWPDFETLGLPGHPSFGWGPIYRGRPDGASIVVLADQASHDDLFLCRGLCGEAGQRLQRWLTAAGLTQRYFILRTLPVDSMGATAAKLAATLSNPAVIALYREAMSRLTSAKAVIAVGANAAVQAPRVNARNLPVIAMPAHGTSGWAARWQAGLASLRAISYPTDVAPSGVYDGGRGQIARIDLPFGMLRWQGTSGDRAAQARKGGKPSRDYFKILMPQWASALDPEPL
jgi:uracil-DNA glycosylase